MGNKKRVIKQQLEDYGPPPDVLSSFFGLNLDEEQTKFRDAIWNKNIDIVFCDSVAGTGKTTIAVGTASLLVKYGLFQKIIYLVSPVQEGKVGFRPGDTDKKLAPYYSPLYDVATDIDINPYEDINVCTEDWNNQGSGYIDCMSHIFLRGRNIKSSTILIIDEAQNIYLDEMKKILTRVQDGAKVIVIGHSGQCDLYNNPQNSGFAPYLQHFSGQDRCCVCSLTQNHRGWVSRFADQLNN